MISALDSMCLVFFSRHHWERYRKLANIIVRQTRIEPKQKYTKSALTRRVYELHTWDLAKMAYCFTPFEINVFQQKWKHDDVKQKTNTDFEIRLQGNYNARDCCIRIKFKHAKGKQCRPQSKHLCFRELQTISSTQNYSLFFTPTQVRFLLNKL